MSSEDAGMAALDARLRRAMHGLDARAGFEARVRARIAAAAPVSADLRAQFEERREAVRRRLRREAWANGISIAGIGIAAAALVWRFAPEIGRAAAGVPIPADPVVIAAVTLAALAFGLWPVLRTLPGFRIG
ncbi:MAG TPA: hypothetical protein VH856_03900 [Steroidobacteraceae bacterium]|jgi:hypothetical protein